MYMWPLSGLPFPHLVQWVFCNLGWYTVGSLLHVTVLQCIRLWHSPLLGWLPPKPVFFIFLLNVEWIKEEFRIYFCYCVLIGRFVFSKSNPELFFNLERRKDLRVINDVLCMPILIKSVSNISFSVNSVKRRSRKLELLTTRT